MILPVTHLEVLDWETICTILSSGIGVEGGGGGIWGGR